MNYERKILPIFLPCYIVQATCTEIALKLRNAKALRSPYVFTRSCMDHVCLQMLIVCIDKYSNEL